MLTRNRENGFTLLELLIVVAIIGLLASVMVPNMIDALHKARQKRTLTDMRGVGTAWTSWLADHTGAASAGAAKVYDNTGFTNVLFTTLESYLRPTDTFFYAQELPQNDAWGGEYRWSMGIDQGNVNRLQICAPARDSTFGNCDQAAIPVGPFLTTDYDQDIVWADGYFVRWPDGLKAN